MNSKPPPANIGLRVAIAIIFGMTLLSGIVHGYLDGRWADQADLNAIGARLADLPERCGDWALTQKLDLSANAARQLQCHGFESRRYTNEKTGVQIQVFVLFGPRGPIAVHTPEICFGSLGSIVQERQLESISTATGRDDFWSVQFSTDSNQQPSMEVWYAWTHGTRWEASENPRYLLTKNLYKIQVAGPVSNEFQQPCREFLEAFLPDLKTILE